MNNMFNFPFRATMAGAVFMMVTITAYADVVVVVSAKSPATALTEEQVANIFLGKSNALPGGGQAVPVDQMEASPSRDEFYQKTTGKSAAQLKAYWSKQIFTGKGQPPKEVGDNNSVKTLLANNPNMIGYIDKSALDASVKALMTTK